VTDALEALLAGPGAEAREAGLRAAAGGVELFLAASILV
jgi:hypothetical protein